MFGRNQFRDGLINLFKNSASPLVVALDEPWGTGKTVFARRLQSKIIEEEAFQAIYFDAFENDHEEDVFIAIASEFLSILEPSRKAEVVKDKAKEVGKVLGRVLLKGGVRLATGGLVRGSDFSEANEEIANEVGDQIEAELDKLIDQRLTSFAKDKETFKSFRMALAEYASDKPIIFIIDELDRCRPDYALSVLETIKHFFSVEGVHFFLVSNSKSLAASVQHHYGNINGLKYLHKFINITVNFPYKDKFDYANICEKFILYSFNGFVVNQNEEQAFKILREFISQQMQSKTYSLRDVEKYIALFKICLLFSSYRSMKLVAILAVLIDMKIFAPDLYTRMADSSLGYDDLVRRYKFDENAAPNQQNRRDWFGMWWRLFLENPTGNEWAEMKSKSSFEYDFDERDPSKPIRDIARDVIDTIT